MIRVKCLKISEKLATLNMFMPLTRTEIRNYIWEHYPAYPRYTINIWSDSIPIELVFDNEEQATWFALKYEV